MTNLIKRDITKEGNMIERREVIPGFQFTLKEAGYKNPYRVLTEEETKAALGIEFLQWLKRLPNFVACKNLKTTLTEAKHIDIICKEGRTSTSNLI